MIFTQLLINGLIAGALYSMVAIGFSLIYSTNKFVHFAHGGVLAASAYIMYWLNVVMGVNFLLACLLTIVFSCFFGLALNIFIYNPLRSKHASSTIMLIAGVAVLTIIESLIIILFEASVKSLGFSNFVSFNLNGAVISLTQSIIIITVILLFIAVVIFFKKTRLGKAMRAVENNKDIAEVLGISSRSVYSWTFVIGSGIAGLASIFIALEENLTPMMGSQLIIKGFTAAVVGGIGSIPGAILGSFILGLAENFGIWYLSSGYKDAIAFVVLFIFLLFKANGILGAKRRS
jgi:branched-chain amino acid transport system permease protein